VAYEDAAAYAAWVGKELPTYYAGDDSDVKVLLGGILAAFAAVTVDAYGAAAESFVREGEHPTLSRQFRECAYRPMIELLRYLEANGFTTYIASGGDRDFMRPITDEIYGIPPERVIGSSSALRYDEEAGTLAYLTQPDVLDDGADQAGAHLEPNRAPADPRGRQFKR
jgi:haloacid dehalogenase-like hydrolase